jgi:hypothetical protein
MGGRPQVCWLFQLDVDDRDDPVAAVDDDDLITNDEIHVPAPLGIDFNERRGNCYNPDAGWHRGAGAEREVDVINPRHIFAGQDRLPDLRPLLRCQVCAAAGLALLPLALRLALLTLPLLRCLTSLALLTLLALRGLIRGLIALSLVRLGGLLAAILLHPLIALALRPLVSLSLRGLARGVALLPLLRLALRLSLGGLLGLTLLRRRLGLLAFGGTTALLASALHALG